MARARRRRPQAATPELNDGLDVPAELHDPDAAVWHDQRAYHRYMTAHGWTLPPAERMGCTTTPANRRTAATAGWARENRIRAEGHNGVDWNRLRAWSLH